MSVMTHTPVFTNDDVRWHAVAVRDAAADGRFVYAVSSTGIFCRPSCPSRRPRQDRVKFFTDPAEAEAAGFRACRRCKPTEPPVEDPWIEKIRRVCAYLSNVRGRPSLAALARRFGGSPYHLQRNFKRIVGVTPREYAEACRLTNVKRRLRGGHAVTGAMLDAGYGSSSGFYQRAVPRLGMSPSAYRKGGHGLAIRYTTVAWPVAPDADRMLVAATERGVCSIAMAASDGALERALSSEYPEAAITRDDGAFGRWVEAIAAHIAGRVPTPALPLDVRATAFQWQVWKALAAIPYGETRSYAEVATAIGRPTAARAVARACATNPVAIIIPCHRVVPSAGGLGGYRWGVARKKQLLAREK